ncbi:YczE/YyaS/YitT family protein [Metabacillus arenae]|uniref:BCR, YitT family protein n=1 Tax=Metabacillus arenae TaxID=2771434 RepID=A0A926NH95_9BACI|nr:BCR, YitT family protein [Metabacillus arenae]MBD1381040.1 BCR, YitT family protein [Metabacillus arenae]
MGKRIWIYLMGLAVTALGIALIILSAAGAGPLDTISVGLTKHFGLTIGIWSIISQVFLAFLTWIIERKRLPVESFIPIIIRSWFLDAWIYIVFNNIDFSASWEMQWLSFMIGVIALGLGIGIYIEAKFPKTPVDGLMIAIHNRFGLSLSISRIIIETSAVLIGFLLGGPVGLGTLIVALTLGRIIQASNHSIKKISNMSV